MSLYLFIPLIFLALYGFHYLLQGLVSWLDDASITIQEATAHVMTGLAWYSAGAVTVWILTQYL